MINTRIIDKKYKDAVNKIMDDLKGIDRSEIDHIIEGFAEKNKYAITKMGNVVCIEPGNNYRRLLHQIVNETPNTTEILDHDDTVNNCDNGKFVKFAKSNKSNRDGKENNTKHRNKLISKSKRKRNKIKHHKTKYYTHEDNAIAHCEFCNKHHGPYNCSIYECDENVLSDNDYPSDDDDYYIIFF